MSDDTSLYVDLTSLSPAPAPGPGARLEHRVALGNHARPGAAVRLAWGTPTAGEAWSRGEQAAPRGAGARVFLRVGTRGVGEEEHREPPRPARWPGGPLRKRHGSRGGHAPRQPHAAPGAVWKRVSSPRSSDRVSMKTLG